MTYDYPLERTIDSCAQLMKDISNARNELQTNAATLQGMLHDHTVLEASKRRLAELTKHDRSLAKRNAALADNCRQEEVRVSELTNQLQLLKRQTEMTEMYLNMLDHEIEEALRMEEADERVRVQQELIKAKKKRHAKKANPPLHAGDDGDNHDEEAESEDEPWSREEEVEYLQLQSAQELLQNELMSLNLHVDAQKGELRAMLTTLEEGERAVSEKRAECALLEEEAEKWRAELERVLHPSLLSTIHDGDFA